MILPGQAEVKAVKSGYTNYFENILEIFKHQHRICGDPLYPGSVTEASGVSLLRRRAFSSKLYGHVFAHPLHVALRPTHLAPPALKHARAEPIQLNSFTPFFCANLSRVIKVLTA